MVTAEAACRDAGFIDNSWSKVHLPQRTRHLQPGAISDKIGLRHARHRSLTGPRKLGPGGRQTVWFRGRESLKGNRSAAMRRPRLAAGSDRPQA